MMKTEWMVAAAAAALMTGCASTQIFEPGMEATNVRQERTVSSEELRIVAREAVRNALTSGKFMAFERKFKQEAGNAEALPILKLDRLVNETDDTELNVNEMTAMINEELLNSGKVDVTLAEGAGRTAAVGNSRGLEDDENFDQRTVAKRGTLQAARLLLRPMVISNTVRDGGRRVVTRTFVMDMVDIHTGLVMWKFTKQLGFVKNRGVVGW